jgi:hypothetical protein
VTTFQNSERSLIPSVEGVKPLVAVGAAAGLTVLGVLIDLVRAGTLGILFTVLYVAGCVLGAVWVRRDGLFGPTVAPPLLLAVAVPTVALLVGTSKPGAGMAQRLLVVGAPLVNAFPMMAWATGLVLAIAIFRLFTQREPRRDPGVRSRPAPGEERAVDRVAARSAAKKGARPGRDAARGEGRTSGSPRRS